MIERQQWPSRLTSNLGRSTCTVIGALLCGSACSSEPPQVPPSPVGPPSPFDPQELTSQECQDLPGTVVGDPGDGSVTSPDFLCSNGRPAVGTIVSLPGEPVATEGAVCCDATPELTRQECRELPGVVVGDPGDGSVSSPGFRCSNGNPPVGRVVPLPGEPIAIEGEVCCGASPPANY